MLAMGFHRLADLRGQSAKSLAADYSRRLDRPEDPLMRQYFKAIVTFAETGSPTPWWRIFRAEAAHDRGATYPEGRPKKMGKKKSPRFGGAASAAVSSPGD